MFNTKTALGIDISDGRINLALLKSDKSGVKLVKAVSGPVPEGAIRKGNIEEPAILAKAIKELKAKNKIAVHRTALSLVASPVLMQILDLPKSVPSNIRQFVQGEVKHYAILPMNQVAIDFCVMKSPDKQGVRRAFVVATDSQKITGYAKVFNEAGLNIDACEPGVVAYIRACYAKKINQKFDRNILFAIVYEGMLTLCVFRNQTLDFVRTKQIEADLAKSERYFEWLADEIYAVIKFYESDVLDKRDTWDVTVVADVSGDSIKEKAKVLWTNVEGVQLEIRTFEEAYLDTPVAESAGADKPSAVAVGLAMKLLNVQQSNLNINMLPREAAEVKSIRKHTFIVANTIAAIIFLMVISVALFSIKANRVNEKLVAQKQKVLQQGTQALLSEKRSMDEQIARLTANLKTTSSVLGTGSLLKWGKVLEDIRLVVPKMIQITNLASSDNSKMLLEGRAYSYDDVNLFVGMLNSCKHIKSASLVETRKDEQSADLVRYSISCLLAQ
jgi:type IV pilus assembly protein PilM